MGSLSRVDLRYTEEEETFRSELKAWLGQVLGDVGPKPSDRTDMAARRAYDTAWQATLFEGGYAGINWPEEVGGRGASPAEHLIFLEETEKAHAPYVGMNFVGLLHAGPTLIAEASDAQKATHLRPILAGTDIWCQGFSEPGSGSDLASLSCRAVRDGDEYVVSGQKIWTSYAESAQYCEMLVRTDTESKHGGITWLIMPMDTPGIDIRPIKTPVGTTEFSEMFLDEVRIPVENRVGDENDGWRVAMVTFSFERGTAFVSELLGSMELLNDVVGLAKRTTSGSATAWDDVSIRHELAELAAEFDALWALTKRNVSQAQRTGLVGPGGNVFKLHYAGLRERLGDVTWKLLGRTGLGFDNLGDLGAEYDHVEERIYALTLRIAAGTSQINKNIVGERVLGLPKER